MTEPRLEESASAFERELLQAGSGYRVSPEARQKTLAALGLGATVGAAGAAAAHSTLFGKLTAAKGWLGLGWVKGTVAAVAAVGALASAPAVYRAVTDGAVSDGAPSEPPKSGAAAPAPQIPAPQAPAPEAAPARDEEAPAAGSDVRQDAASEDARPVEREVRKGSRASAAKSEPPEVTTEVLRAELAALDAARAKLSSGSPQGALAALDEYGRSYPRGLLRLEAEVLRIDALAQAGQTEAAKARASAFLRQHPKGVLAARVRRYAEP